MLMSFTSSEQSPARSRLLHSSHTVNLDAVREKAGPGQTGPAQAADGNIVASRRGSSEAATGEQWKLIHCSGG